MAQGGQQSKPMQPMYDRYVGSGGWTSQSTLALGEGYTRLI